MNRRPKYPIYVISKGRWESRLTVKALELMKQPFSIVIEPQEYDQYAAVIDPAKILVLPFSNLGQGSIPARNWVWEHAAATGAERHWIMDDNIRSFMRLQYNMKLVVETPAIIAAMEHFADRYENVAIAGPHYDYFAPHDKRLAPFVLNTRVYSCILLRNDLRERYPWRGRYNEDTDLSIRVLKDGWCTILFQALLQQKTPTMQMKGGNTDVLYNQGDNRREFAESLYNQHPDVVQVVEKYGRWHHQVNYLPFKHNKLIPRPGLVIPDGYDNFGMVLKEFPLEI